MLGDTAVGMNHLTEKMTHFVAMRESTRRAHISCHQNLAVFDDDTSAATTVAGGAFSHSVGKIHEILIPRRTFILLILNILQHFFHLLVKVFDAAVVLEHIISLMDALAEVLFVRVGIAHLTLLVSDKCLVTHGVSLRFTLSDTLIAHFTVGVDGKQMEVTFSAQSLDLARGTDALNDGIFPIIVSTVVELFGYVTGRVVRTQVVSHRCQSVAVDLQATAFHLFR